MQNQNPHTYRLSGPELQGLAAQLAQLRPASYGQDQELPNDDITNPPGAPTQRPDPDALATAWAEYGHVVPLTAGLARLPGSELRTVSGLWPLPDGRTYVSLWTDGGTVYVHAEYCQYSALWALSGDKTIKIQGPRHNDTYVIAYDLWGMAAEALAAVCHSEAHTALFRSSESSQ